MPTGIQTYNLELHKVEPFDWSGIDDDLDIDFVREKYKDDEIILVNYKDYTLEIHRHEYKHSDKTYIQSWIEILKGELTLRDTYRFEPDDYHPDGMILTDLPLMTTTTKDPISAEYKLLDKARAIIDRLDENGQAVLEMCNKGNILEMAQ